MSIILHLYFLTFVEMKYTSSLPLSLKTNINIESLLHVYSEFQNKFKKYNSSILLSLIINALILKVYFKYSSKSENKYINSESLLQVYFVIKICVTKMSKFEVFAYGNFFTYFLYLFKKQVQGILEVYFINRFLIDSEYTWKILPQNYLLNYFPIIFHKVGNFGSHSLQKYTWSIFYT